MPLEAGLQAGSQALSDRQRIALLHGSGLKPAEVLELDDAEFRLEALLRRGCTAANIVCSGVNAGQLRERGVKHATTLRRLGFDSLHLVDSSICSDFSREFGADAVQRAFLTSASDAVVVAGTEAVSILCLTPDFLLSLCAGAPIEASNVIAQHDTPAAELMKEVTTSVLLDTGLRAAQLRSLGIGFVELSKLKNFAPGDACKFGLQL